MRTDVLDLQTLMRLLDLDGYGFLSQAYLHLLGRRIDSDGMRSYLAQLYGGASKASILYSIHVSPEGVKHSGAHHGQIAHCLIELALRDSLGTEGGIPSLLRLDLGDFIKATFHRVAQRPPYTAEIEFFANQINRGASKLDVLKQIASAVRSKDAAAPGVLAMEAAISEWQRGLYPTAKSMTELLRLEDVAFVDCAYKTFLKRPPDMDGLLTYLAAYRAGAEKLAIIRSIAKSGEGRRLNVSLEGLRGAMIRYKLGRLWFVRGMRAVSLDPTYEASRRDSRAIYRALLRILCRQDESAAVQDGVVQNVNDILSGRIEV